MRRARSGGQDAEGGLGSRQHVEPLAIRASAPIPRILRSSGGTRHELLDKAVQADQVAARQRAERDRLIHLLRTEVDTVRGHATAALPSCRQHPGGRPGGTRRWPKSELVQRLRMASCGHALCRRLRDRIDPGAVGVRFRSRCRPFWGDRGCDDDLGSDGDRA